VLLQSKRHERHPIGIGTAIGFNWCILQEWLKMQQEAFVQGINVPDPPGMVWAFNPRNLSSFCFCEDFCCSGSHQRRVCAAFLLRHKPNSPTMPNDQFCACEENPDLKQHENERGAKLSVHSAETGLALTFTGRAALLETIPEARHASTLVLSFDSSFQLHEQAATETEAGTFLHSVL
jgi:hypothetical protein